MTDHMHEEILAVLSPEQRANVEAMRQEYRTYAGSDDGVREFALADDDPEEDPAAHHPYSPMAYPGRRICLECSVLEDAHLVDWPCEVRRRAYPHPRGESCPACHGCQVCHRWYHGHHCPCQAWIEEFMQ